MAHLSLTVNSLKDKIPFGIFTSKAAKGVTLLGGAGTRGMSSYATHHALENHAPTLSK